MNKTKASKQINKTIENISKDWNADERETSILFDHHSDLVYLETTEPFTARRWVAMFEGDPNVKFDRRSDSLKIQVPAAYCRKPDLIIKATHRKGCRKSENAA